MRIVKVSNLYGFPSLSPVIVKYAKDRGYTIIAGISELGNVKGTTILVAGFAMLQSFNIPIIGYKMAPNGVAHKTSLPAKLKANEVEVRVYKFSESLPKSEVMLEFFLDGKETENMSLRFKKGNKDCCLNNRIFTSKVKR